MGKIVLFMGASASGKDTIVRKLVQENIFNLKEITMHTTRPMRAGEENGREYFFSSVEEMLAMEQSGKIIESRSYDTIYGPWHYFTADTHIDLENNNYIASNTLEGFDQYLKHYSEEEIISILIQTEDGLRLSRALEREQKEQNPKYEELCRRFLADCKDFSKDNIERRPITAIIQNNGTLEDAMEEVNRVLSLHL